MFCLHGLRPPSPHDGFSFVRSAVWNHAPDTDSRVPPSRDGRLGLGNWLREELRDEREMPLPLPQSCKGSWRRWVSVEGDHEAQSSLDHALRSRHTHSRRYAGFGLAMRERADLRCSPPVAPRSASEWTVVNVSWARRDADAERRPHSAC
jgi:hypothetical protein